MGKSRFGEPVNHTHPIRILIVDDHAMVRSGLRMFLMAFDDLDLVGEAVNGVEAVNLAAKLNPDIILMDLIMPNMDGLHATQKIHKKFPRIKIIALTSFTESQLIDDAFKAGISGFLYKDATANELANIIRNISSGNVSYSPVSATLSDSQPSVAKTTNIELTLREKQVLALLSIGKSNTEISAELTLSLSTIKFHVSNILSKLEANSRGEAVSIARRNHLIE
ncbi:MAG: DNA-binding response regulator [Chloroflexi bacterium HGW-Chloroflexi-5]|jgi:NarL family two-component system response regulator LiaR|nr:MAG: DNA-binding response regulator [Chloroflexi bacterium HGW-Chloroflexi-5]